MNTQRLRHSRAFCNLEYLVALTILAVLASLGVALINKCHQQSQLRESHVRVNGVEQTQH